MKLRVDLQSGETLTQVEENLEKALKAKKECSSTEQYIDPALNKFHDSICERHDKLVKSILNEVTTEIVRYAYSKGTHR